MTSGFSSQENLIESLSMLLSIVTLYLIGFSGWWTLLACVLFFPMTIVYMLICILVSEFIGYLWNLIRSLYEQN